jgi:hypothetical protein
MEFRIKIEELKKIGLSLTQYIAVWGIYNGLEIAFNVTSQEGLNDLEDKQYIGRDPMRPDQYLITSRALELFEPSGGVFDDFIKAFPTRVKDQHGIVRVLSPDKPDTLSGQKLLRKWHTITKNKEELQEHILSCLKKEVELRSKEGNLFWMRNCETWLNKCTWEDYEYLLDTQIKENTGFKINEIHL